MYHTVWSNTLQKRIVKPRCGWCGIPITSGGSCRESTGKGCKQEDDYWHEQQMLEDERRIEESRFEQMQYEALRREQMRLDARMEEIRNSKWRVY
jgi:hypothetical protein